MMIIKVVYCAWMIFLKCTVLVHGTGLENIDFELIPEIDMSFVDDINPDNFHPDYSSILDSLPREDWQNDTNGAQQTALQEEQASGDSRPLDVPALSNAVNTVDINEGFSASASLSLPSTSTGTASSISSVQECSPAGSAKRACDTAKKEKGEQKAGKRQKTNTTTSTAAEANTALMDEKEVHLAVEEFNRYFREDKKVISRLPPYMLEFAKDLAQRGLTSTHLREIVDLCTASKQWLGHGVFWRMLLFFVDTLSLEVTYLKRIDGKKTVVLRNRKIQDKLLSDSSDRYIRYVIAKCQGAERMEIEYNLNILEGRGTEDMLGVLRWLLYHVKIECIGISCDLAEASMNSVVFGRQVNPLTKEWRGSSVCIDSLALHFTRAQYMSAAEIVKEFPWVTVLKIHFMDIVLYQVDNRKQALKALLLHCPVLEQLSVFGLCVGIDHIRIIAPMLPQLMLLEVEFLTSETQEEEEESTPVFPGLKTLKILDLYIYYLDADIKKLMGLFSNLKDIQMPAKYVTSPLVDALSKLRLLRSLEIINGTLNTETAEYLLEKLSNLECLSVGVRKLDNNLAQALSKYAGMHTLRLRGKYTPGFLASLLRPSPLMNTLRVLDLRRYYIDATNNPSPEDKHSKKEAMKKFGCMVQMIYS
ncbi:hypothetical protein NECID01_1326 [Nematocida sp. AWRm77]|nr:hypothetical protein NECID01_1326 [Nematocida sp. AWRm77]